MSPGAASLIMALFEDDFDAKEDLVNQAERTGPSVVFTKTQNHDVNLVPGGRLGEPEIIEGPDWLMYTTDDPVAREGEALKWAYDKVVGHAFRYVSHTVNRLGRVVFYKEEPKGWGVMDPENPQVILRCVVSGLSRENMKRLVRTVTQARLSGENSPEWVRAFLGQQEPPAEPVHDIDPNGIDEAAEEAAFADFDAKDDLLDAVPVPKIIWRRCHHTTSIKQKDLNEVKEVFDCRPGPREEQGGFGALNKAQAYLQGRAEGGPGCKIATIRQAYSAYPQRVMFSGRKQWPAGPAYTDRYIVTGFSEEDLRLLVDRMLRYIYDSAGALVGNLLEDEGDFDAKEDLLAAVPAPFPYLNIYKRVNGLPILKPVRYDLGDDSWTREAMCDRALRLLTNVKAKPRPVYSTPGQPPEENWFFGPDMESEVGTEQLAFVARDFKPDELANLKTQLAGRLGESLVEAEDFDAKEDLMASAQLPKAVHLDGRRWFCRNVGGSYTKVHVWVDGKFAGSAGPIRGYGSAYEDAGMAWLENHGFIPIHSHQTQGYLDPSRRFEQLGIDYTRTVQDVKRKKDL